MVIKTNVRKMDDKHITQEILKRKMLVSALYEIYRWRDVKLRPKKELDSLEEYVNDFMEGFILK